MCNICILISTEQNKLEDAGRGLHTAEDESAWVKVKVKEMQMLVIMR